MDESTSRTNAIHGTSLSGADCTSVSCAERELRDFIHSLSDLVSAKGVATLREMWLDEVASLTNTPEPTSSEWRLVTMGAYLRVAQHLVEMRNPWGFL